MLIQVIVIRVIVYGGHRISNMLRFSSVVGCHGSALFFISNSVFNLSLELMVFAKFRLNFANELLRVIDNPRLKFLSIGKPPPSG